MKKIIKTGIRIAHRQFNFKDQVDRIGSLESERDKLKTKMKCRVFHSMEYCA
jgi:hypothetical protein